MTYEITTRGGISDFVDGMPKAELHLHLDATLEPGMKVMIAERNGLEISPSTEPEIRATLQAHHDLPSFLAVHQSNLDVLRTSRDFEDLAFGYLSTAAAGNIRHAEMIFDPQLHTRRGIGFADMVSGYRRAIVRAERAYGISAELILCFQRELGAEDSMAMLTEAIAYKSWIIGIGSDGDERGHPPLEFAEVFARARDEGFLISVHCDVDQENTHEHIRQAIFEIGADRIDHGLNIIDAPDLLAAALQRRLGFTVCPLPYGTHVAGFEHEVARIARMAELGLQVSLGSDGPPYFGGYLSDNMQACLDAGFSRQTILDLQRNAFATAWISNRRRDAHLEELDAYAASWGLR